MLEGVRRGGYNKTEESEITMQEEEGMVRKKGGLTGGKGMCGTTRAALMACGKTDQRSRGWKNKSESAGK